MANDEMMNEAFDLANEGRYVFPCKRDKTPYTEHGLKDASTDSGQIRKWWTKWPTANVAIDCGQSRLVVVDIDDLVTCQRVNDDHPKWMNTRRVRTGKGGLHLYYNAPAGLTVKSKNRCIVELPGVDIKAEGGYVIAAGANDKGPYQVDDNRPAARMPGDLLELLVKNKVAVLKENRDQGPVQNARQGPQEPQDALVEESARHYLDEAVRKAHSGNRNETGFWLAGQIAALTRSGYSERECERIMLEYQRHVDSPKNPYRESEAMASLRSALRSPREPALVKTPKNNGNNGSKKSDASKPYKNTMDKQEESDELKEALKILKKGKPINYVLETFHKDYVGGEEYGRLLLFSALCGTCTNTMGLHPGVDGESGVGKSFAMKSMINLIPAEFAVSATISPKALFYNNIQPGSVIYLDDVGVMPEDLAQIIKISTSKYQEGTRHLTVTKQNGENKELPKCLNWWITGVDANSFDKQILNRNVNVSLDELNKVTREEHKTEIYLHQLEEAANGRPANLVTQEALICRELIGHLLKSPQVNVAIPWLLDDDGVALINWNNIDNSRNFPIFMDLIRVSASIHRYQRKTTPEGRLIANLEDYDNAIQIWNRVSREQVSKLNRKDQQVLQALMDLTAYDTPVNLKDLALKLKLSETAVRERLHGRPNDGVKGLLDRDYRVVYEKETITEYDVKIEGEDQFERERKTGSKGRPRTMIKLSEKIDFLNMGLDIVTIDRVKVQAQLDKLLK